MDEYQHLLNFIKSQGTLCLDVKNPLWANAKGYFFDEKEGTLYFPISKRYLQGKSSENYQIKIPGSRFRYAVLTGQLNKATADSEINKIFNYLVKKEGVSIEMARYALFDKRNNKPRQGRYKLRVKKALFHDPEAFGNVVKEIQFPARG